MTARTITLRSELVEQLEKLARAQGRTLDDVLRDLLEQYTPPGNNWALTLAEEMEKADIDWIDEPNASAHSRDHFQQYNYEKWQRTQNTDTGEDG